MTTSEKTPLLIKACRREATPRPPIWLMRQAGRYMASYRKVRDQVDFLTLCKTPDLAAEVTVDAANRLGVDAAIIFSDILLILEPMGFKLTYEKGEGPVIHNPFRSEADIKRLLASSFEPLTFVMEAIRKTRHSLPPHLPIIGFAGAPFTIAAYAIQGEGDHGFPMALELMRKNPKLWHALLEKLSEATIQYLNAQVEAGAQVIQLFDSWVGLLSEAEFQEYAAPYIRRIIGGIHNYLPPSRGKAAKGRMGGPPTLYPSPASGEGSKVPIIFFGTNTGHLLSLIKETGADVIGLDSKTPLDQAWKTIGDKAIQGNLDPRLLLKGTRAQIETEAKHILTQAGGRPGHIFNLGHGVLPETPEENVVGLVEYVKVASSH